MRRHVCALVVVALGWSGVARADPTSAEKESRALFDEARVLIERGDCRGATPKLLESLGRNPSIGAHLSLAECREQDDPLGAWRAYGEAERLARAKGDNRASHARAHAAALEPRLAMLRLWIEPTLRALPAFDLRVDGRRVDADWVAGAVAFEATKHVVEASASGRKPFRIEVEAVTGVVTPIEIRLEEERAGPVRENGPEPVGEGAGDQRRRIGWILGAAGAAVLGFGTVAGLVTLGKKHDLEAKCSENGGSFPDRCGGATTPPADRQDALRSDTKSMNTWATVSTVTFALGAVALASGVTLYLTAPKGIGVGVRPGAVALEGAW
jgi:hypothetical protein